MLAGTLSILLVNESPATGATRQAEVAVAVQAVGSGGCETAQPISFARRHRMLRVITVVLQIVVAYIPWKLHHDMGHRIWYSIKTYGLVGEVIWQLVIVGVPSAMLWLNYRSSRRRTSAKGVVVSYAVGLAVVAFFVALSCLVVAASGLR